MGNSATVPNPDPYLKDTADPTPACVYQFNLADTNGYPIAALAVIYARVVLDVQDAARQDRRRRRAGRSSSARRPRT